MTSPASIALRAEVDQALTILLPQIRGLEDLSKVSLSEPTLEFVNQEITDHRRRRDRCAALLTALDSLEADGYPEMPKAEVPVDVFTELQGEHSDIEAALSEFEPLPQAAVVNVTLDNPADI